MAINCWKVQSRKHGNHVELDVLRRVLALHGYNLTFLRVFTHLNDFETNNS